ncbi:hypothetical protein HIM_09001 [Hirsutella minnesotensis 3608]|uniref:F-box domain-containing protein n=1 Tax=Hirsutella minnesotensis 3608 TaxID=1043627 RepID=A0A0F7ZY00_9HYPO|nr:hypothetical protein HIM_09001 [Hirsutella minnesotensis 3608]
MSISSIPTELLVQITSGLGTRDLAALVLCCRTLHRRFEPSLYGTQERLMKVMRYDCLHGNPHIIDRAKSYGASISIVPICVKRHGGSGEEQGGVLTLYLTAKANQLSTFRYLLDCGASIEGDKPNRLRPQIVRLMKKLAAPQIVELLHAFLEKGLDAQVRYLRNGQIAWPLVPAILSGASPELVQLLLDKGADPNQLLHIASRKRKLVLSPLSAAISVGSREVLDLLASNGASFTGRHSRCVVNEPIQLPIFAAAKAMANNPSLGIQWMRLCIDNNCDINQVVRTTTRWCNK